MSFTGSPNHLAVREVIIVFFLKGWSKNKQNVISFSFSVLSSSVHSIQIKNVCVLQTPVERAVFCPFAQTHRYKLENVKMLPLIKDIKVFITLISQSDHTEENLIITQIKSQISCFLGLVVKNQISTNRYKNNMSLCYQRRIICCDAAPHLYFLWSWWGAGLAHSSSPNLN